jgi:alanine racemase
MAMAHALDAAARKRGAKAAAHVKLDTGMGRIGIPASRAEQAADTFAKLDGIRLVGGMTHFPAADNADEFTREQVRACLAVKQRLSERGLSIPMWHAANSAGVLWFPESHLDAVRPGISLYGAYPAANRARPVELRPALTLKTHIAQVRDVPPGGTVSYGRTFRAARPSRIAVLPIGYADGFSRQNSNRGQVLVRGRRVPVVGRVCMDLTLADVTDIPDATAGDPVVLYGRQGQEQIRLEDVANLLGTVPQDVMTAISRRVPRAYVDSSAGASGGAPTR